MLNKTLLFATCAVVLLIIASVMAASAEIVLIDGTDNAGATTDGDGYTLNGSFETVDGSKPTFWQVYPGAGNQGAADVISNHNPPGTDPEAGSRTAIIGDNSLTTEAINTHQADGENEGTYKIQQGDTYTLSFKHAGAWSWSDADNIEWSLFYTADNTTNGAITTLFSGNANTLARTGGAPPFTMNWQTESVTTAAVADPGAVGKYLWLGFKPIVGDGTGFARIDEVNLTSSGYFPSSGTIFRFK